MSALSLYNHDLDENCYRVRLMLSFLGMDHETIAVDMIPGAEEKSPPMLALNPLGTLPIIRDGDVVLHGTEAILSYLARAYDQAGRWLPLEARAYGHVSKWLNFSSAVLQQAVEARKTAVFGLPGDLEAMKRVARDAFRIMDDHMTLQQFEGAEWFVGSDPTIADVALLPSFALSRDFGIDHDEFPALRRWLRRFRTIKGFKTMPGIPDYH